MQGQLLDRDTQAPVDGAFVVLLDETSAEVGGSLTNVNGRFRLGAPAPGLYSVRAERIGYETVFSQPFVLGRGQVYGLELMTGEAAIELAELRVEAEQQCVVRPSEGLLVASVWDEARKALSVQAWTEGESLYRFRLVSYERDLEANSLRLISETRSASEAMNRNPIRSLPVEDLLENGFIRPAGDGGYFYYGPDASVLLSDPFLDTHCFRLTTSPEQPGSVGLAFEPVRRRSTPDIQGTLWLDRETAKLRFLEYGYDWAPWVEASHVAQGRVEFQEMPNGAWIVQKWWIRMPGVARIVGAPGDGRSEIRVVRIKEVGGEVARVTAPNRQVLAEAASGTLEGQVWDSIGSTPLPSATVFLSGTHYATTTDQNGEFVLTGLPEGSYTLSFTHPSLDSLGVFSQGVPVDLVVGETAYASLAGPSPGTLETRICGTMEREAGDAIVTGVVRGIGSSNPVSGATVTVEWRTYSQFAGDLRENRRGARVSTDTSGRYTVCGIPPRSMVAVEAKYGELIHPLEEFEAPRGEIVVRNLMLRPSGITP